MEARLEVPLGVAGWFGGGFDGAGQVEGGGVVVEVGGAWRGTGCGVGEGSIGVEVGHVVSVPPLEDSPTLKNEIKWGTYVVKFHFLISFLSVCLCVYTSNKPVIAVQSYTCLMQGATWVLGGRLPTKTPAGICETLWLARMHVPAF